MLWDRKKVDEERALNKEIDDKFWAEGIPLCSMELPKDNPFEQLKNIEQFIKDYDKVKHESLSDILDYGKSMIEIDEETMRAIEPYTEEYLKVIREIKRKQDAKEVRD